MAKCVKLILMAFLCLVARASQIYKIKPLSSLTCPPISMQLTGRKTIGQKIMHMRIATCVGHKLLEFRHE